MMNGMDKFMTNQMNRIFGRINELDVLTNGKWDRIKNQIWMFNA